MTVAISTMLPDLRVELPGIAEPILAGAVYRILRKFYWETEAWKYTYDNGLNWTLNQLALNSPVAGTDIPTKTKVKRVDTIMYDAGGDAWDTPVPFKTIDELDRLNPDWQTETGSSPQYWTHGNDGGAVITPQTTATVTTAFLIRSIIFPLYTAMTDTLPDFLYYAHEETIRQGILADLMKQPGKDWTNTQMAAYYAKQYLAGKNMAKSHAEASFGQPLDSVVYGGL